MPSVRSAASATIFTPRSKNISTSFLNRVDIPKKDIRSIILTGSDLELVASVCGAEKSGDLYTISAKKMHAAYKEIRMMSHSAIARRYNISEELAEILYTALYIYRHAAPFGRRAEGHLPGYRYLRCHHTPHARAGRAKRIHCANKRKRHCFRKTHRGKIQLPRRTFRRHFRVCMHAFRQIQKPARSVK